MPELLDTWENATKKQRMEFLRYIAAEAIVAGKSVPELADLLDEALNGARRRAADKLHRERMMK